METAPLRQPWAALPWHPVLCQRGRTLPRSSPSPWAVLCVRQGGVWLAGCMLERFSSGDALPPASLGKGPVPSVAPQVPNITAIHPAYGPLAGGTQLSIRGRNLTVGSSWRVTLAGVECPVAGQQRYSKHGALSAVLAWGAGLGPLALGQRS